MSDGLGDFFGSGGGGAPATSWDEQKVGDSFTGIIVPADPDEPEVGYRTTHATNVKQEPLYWTIDKKQVTDAVTNGQPNRPVTQAEITILTEFRNYEFMSAQAKKRAQGDEREDDGARRVFVKGPSLPAALREAIKLIQGRNRKPLVGAILTVKLVKRTPNDHGGKTNEFEVVYGAPTEANITKAKAYSPATSISSDGGAQEEDPPF